MQIRARPTGARKKSFNSRERRANPSYSSYEDPGTPFVEDSPSISHGYVKSFDGTKLFYSSEGKGAPLVFCYGLICSSLHWTYQIEHFRKNYRAIWFDYRGHQNSDIPADLSTVTIENSAKDLAVVLDELGVEKAVLLGHSMGVNVVLDFYRLFPSRVAGMVLANGVPRRPLENLFRNNSFQGGFKFLAKMHKETPSFVKWVWKIQKQNPLARTMVGLSGFNPHLTAKEDIELYVDQVADTDPSIFLQMVSDYDRYDANAWLHTIQSPTLILAGEEDRVTPIEQQELMHQLIPHSQLEVIRHGSHCPQMDLPDLVNLKIEKFLAELNYGRRDC